jgi:hypothetical protein
MTKTHRRKNEPDDIYSKNQGHAIKYRKRLQEDAETEKELKDFVKDTDADQPIQDPIRGKYLP